MCEAWWGTLVAMVHAWGAMSPFGGVTVSFGSAQMGCEGMVGSCFMNVAIIVLGNPTGASWLGLTGAPGTGLGLGKTGAGSTGIVLVCTEYTGAGLI